MTPPSPRNLTRFNIVGSSGSGKSTFASQLASLLDLKYIEIDAVYWKPNWTESSDEEFFSKLKKALSSESWVADGNYSRSIPVKWEYVQAVIWLDLPYWQIIYQVIKRTLRRSIKKEVLWAGNRESLWKVFFSKDSIIL